MNLETEIFRTQGRAPQPIAATVIRELEMSDLVLLQNEKGSRPCAIKRITERHHALARNLAGGMSESDAAIFCGYSLSRVSILKDDPAFKELLEFYREDVNRQYRGLHEKLSGLASDAADLLQEKLEEDAALEVAERKVPVGQLMELTKMGADRTGHGPQSSQLNVNVDLAGRLELARKRVARRKLEVIEGGIIEAEARSVE